MNILVTHRAVDIATYKMLGLLSRNESFKIYVAVPSEKEKAKLEGNCIPLQIPSITSKFSWKVIRTLRKYVKEY
ncbi:MAG: glycosyl transferase, partial [Bacteroides acidifaciens]|nr:glycosyl transferase [Bacteroides acidifaciens]